MRRVHWEATDKLGTLLVNRRTRDDALSQMSPSRVGRIVKVTRFDARETMARREVFGAVERHLMLGGELGDLMRAYLEYRRIESEAKK